MSGIFNTYVSLSLMPFLCRCTYDVSCQCVNEDAIIVSNLKCTNQAPGALTARVTYQHLGLFILCVGSFSLTEEGGGPLIQVCRRR